MHDESAEPGYLTVTVQSMRDEELLPKLAKGLKVTDCQKMDP